MYFVLNWLKDLVLGVWTGSKQGIPWANHGAEISFAVSKKTQNQQKYEPRSQ